MIAVWIILFVVLFVVLVLNLRAHFIFEYKEQFKVTLKILFFRFDAVGLFQKILNGNNKKNEMETKKGSFKKVKKKSADLLGFADFLVHLTKVIGLAVKEHFSKATVNLKELKVSVGSEDAAKTALLCSTVTQAANGLCALLMHFSKFRCDNKNLMIAPDFSTEKTSVSLYLVMSSKVIDIIKLIFNTYFRFFEGKENDYARNSVKTGH